MQLHNLCTQKQLYAWTASELQLSATVSISPVLEGSGQFILRSTARSMSCIMLPACMLFDRVKAIRHLPSRREMTGRQLSYGFQCLRCFHCVPHSRLTVAYSQLLFALS